MFLQIGHVGFAIEDISAYDLEHVSEKGKGVRLMLKTRTEILTPSGITVSRRGLYDFYDENAEKLRWFFKQALENNQIIDLDKQWSDHQTALQPPQEPITIDTTDKVRGITLEDRLKASLKKLKKD